MNNRRTAFHVSLSLLLAGQITMSACPSTVTAAERPQDFEIRVIDQETRRGIPLVQLTTVNDVRYVTDNAGRIAYPTDEDAGQTVFFFADAQGYEIPKDGFGIAGFRLQVAAGRKTELALKRLNVAERLYRITGRGLYRDSLLLGHDTPLRDPAGAGQVAGQDSVQPAVYRDRIYWFWGDTSRMSYPLGLFRAAGATSQLPGHGGLPPSQGIDLDYFVGEDGFVRAMADVPDAKGVVWIDGICTVSASDGSEKLIGHFSRRPGLAEQYEHGIVVYNDEREIFEVASVLPLDETWRFPQSHPTRVFTDHAGQETAAPSAGDESATSWLYFGQPFPVTRVPATLDAVLDVSQYESWTCCGPSDAGSDTRRPERDDSGALVRAWRKEPPVAQQDEQRWLRQGLLQNDELQLLPVDMHDDSHRVVMHGGTVHWNAYRGRWILIAIESCMQKDCPSMLGEVWYSESDSPTGPFRVAVRIATHSKQSFYNPCHHPFFDEEGGRYVYFEGTYCNTFTNSPATPRYNYNQIMYRLDLSRPEVQLP